MNQKKLRAAVEAMLFAYAEPLGADKLAQALQMPVSSVEPVLEELRTRYAREDSGLCLLHLNTHWQLATKADFAEPVRRVLDTRRSVPLGPAAMETLTVIAYNQPVSRAFIDFHTDGRSKQLCFRLFRGLDLHDPGGFSAFIR